LGGSKHPASPKDKKGPNPQNGLKKEKKTRARGEKRQKGKRWDTSQET